MSVERERGRLLRLLIDRLPRPLPEDRTDLFELLRRRMEERVGRPLALRIEHFPHNTASGFWARLPDLDVIVIEASTPPDHQLVVLGHELWHMHRGECKNHAAPPEALAAAARKLGEIDAELGRALFSAARSSFAEEEERDAEIFGFQLASHVQRLLREDAVAPDPLSRRIRASLGRTG